MFERRIGVIAIIVLAALLLVSTRIFYWQLWRGDELYLSLLDPLRAVNSQQGPEILAGEGLQELPQPLVQRTMDMLRGITRGSILDRSGKVLAEDQVQEDGELQRVYTDPSLANVIGYTTGIRTGATGLERSYNTVLLGLDRLDAQVQQLVHAPVTGSTLKLTIDLELQQAAAQALAGRPGAIVILDGHSGAVLAMASAPGFDPNRIGDQAYVNSLLACETAECRAPFLNRATQSLYTPGSTWKTITLIAALDSGQVTPETVFDFGEPLRDQNGKLYYVYRVGGGVIPDPNHSEDRLALPLAYGKSANAAFARIGAEMSPETFIEYARRLGFGDGQEVLLPSEIPAVPSQLAQDVEEIRGNDLLRAATAIGQGELLTHPYGMAASVLPVLNDGRFPVPYLVDGIQEPGGLSHRGPLKGQARENVMTAETARQVKAIMVDAVENGYGGRAKVEGAVVGGKTGTAQLGGDQAPHAWFLGWAERDERAVIIAVMLENGGEGSVVAAPVFAQLVNPALDALSPAGGE